MGKIPQWYMLLRASRYLRVPPWELFDQPSHWQNWALAAEYAENEAESQRMKRQNSSKGIGS